MSHEEEIHIIDDYGYIEQPGAYKPQVSVEWRRPMTRRGFSLAVLIWGFILVVMAVGVLVGEALA